MITRLARSCRTLILWLFLAIAPLVPPPAFAYDGLSHLANPVLTSSGYDVCDATKVMYDRPAVLIVADGETPVYLANEEERPVIERWPLFANFPKFLAAENAPLANILEGHPAGQGFTGVYDASTGNVLIAPSTADAEIPAGWVARAGGHADVSAALGGDAANQSGFAVILQEDGTLNITWTSRTLNPAPSFQVPENLQQTIINTVQSATGRTVNP
jgi:hypothetical protein